MVTNQASHATPLVHLEFAGTHRRAANVSPHAHACPELILINEGECDVQLEDGGIHAGPDDLIAIPPHHTHDQQSDGHIDTFFCGFVASHTASWVRPRVITLRDATFIRHCMSLLAMVYAGLEVKASPAATDAVLLAVLEQIEYHDEQHQETRQMPARMVAAMRFLEDHLDEPLTIEQVAQHAHMSASNLHLLFRTHLRTSPMQYLQEQRMRAARNALLTPYLSVKEVSTMCGFTDVNYFVRTFRKRHRLPPGRWRSEQMSSLGRRIPSDKDAR